MYIILHYLTENWMISAMWQFTVGQLVQLLQYAENKKKKMNHFASICQNFYHFLNRFLQECLFEISFWTMKPTLKAIPAKH